MKNIVLLIIAVCSFTMRLTAQETAEYNAIKLFIDQEKLSTENPTLPEPLRQRLYTKVMQLINQTGVAEVGYSNFLVTPKFDVLGTSLDEASIPRLYLAECELSLSISRRDFSDQGAASYASFSKKLIGSGSSKDNAIANAINNISPQDNTLVGFFKQSKAKIDHYFKTNCKEIIKEAIQAYDLKEFGKSIALYFSVPSSAPCYEEARSRSIGVYVRYIEDNCDKQLIQLKALIALAQTNDATASAKHYSEVLAIMKNLNPTSPKCYNEAKLLIQKIENRFNEQQKREWELESKRSITEAQLKKEMYKAMGRISSNYQPSSGAPTVIIAK